MGLVSILMEPPGLVGHYLNVGYFVESSQLNPEYEDLGTGEGLECRSYIGPEQA